MDINQRHPYKPFVPEGASILILGSAPPRRFCKPLKCKLKEQDVDWYYGSYNSGRYNYFWEILFKVFEPEVINDLNNIRALRTQRRDRTAQQRQFFEDFLKRHKIGIADLFTQFKRIKESDKDQDIRVEKYRSITEILNRHTHIKSVCCTSEFVYWKLIDALPKNKKIVYNTWMKYDYLLEGIDAVPVPDRVTQRKIKLISLLSPSPVNRINYTIEELVINYTESLKPSK